MAGSTEVPVVRRFGPCTVSSDGLGAILNGVGNSKAKDLRSGTGGVVTEDGKSSESQTTIANAVPVSLGVVGPPAMVLAITVRVGCDTLRETERDDILSECCLLVSGPDVVEPIVGNGERGGEFGGIEEMGGVPFVSSRWTEAVRDGILQVTRPQSRNYDPFFENKTNLEFCQCAINPLGILRHPICICESLDPHLDLTRIIQDTTISIHMVCNRRQRVILRRVSKDSIVPLFEVRIVCNEFRKSLPLIRWRDETWSVRSDVRGRRVRRLERIFGPRERGVGGRVERRGSESSGIRLNHATAVTPTSALALPELGNKRNANTHSGWI